jgi:TRAP-type C4-dicarboxylate transport system permease small subunit
MASAAPSAPGRGGVLARLESAVTAFERGLIVVLLALMASAVFLDALHRIFAARQGRLERLLVALLPGFLEGAARAAIAPAILFLATFGVSYGALRTRQAAQGSRARAAAIAALVTLALAAATQLLIRGLPNGLVWSQQMALCFMLWVGLAGASLATREHTHIVFEMAGKIWPRPLQRPIELLARLVAAGFSFFLAVLAAAHAREHYLEWTSSGGTAGLFEAFRVPRWTIFGFLPVPFTVMAVRFLSYGVRAPAGRPNEQEGRPR